MVNCAAKLGFRSHFLKQKLEGMSRGSRARAILQQMELSAAARRYFTNNLMTWHREDNDRSLPWKQEKDPYKIWLSEIILQQTRAQQGLPYYLAFTKNYPTVKKLAAAPDEDVFRLWQGLGYYNRCRNLLATARYISGELKGKFPDTYDHLLGLKGVGPYTAAAIASFSYNLPHAVTDGNVIRVLSRFFGIETAFDTTAGKKQFMDLADELLDKKDPAGYNQAIMDLGATVCTPAVPACGDCPLTGKCFAFRNNLVSLLPVKSKKPLVRTRYFHYVFLIAAGKLWISKRTGKDIWQNLFEPLLLEHGQPLSGDELTGLLPFSKTQLRGTRLKLAGEDSRKLTHRIIETRSYLLHLKQPFEIAGKQGQWVDFNRLDTYPFPRGVVSFLEKNVYF
jgi:A/G-specific adenine glycosylase